MVNNDEIYDITPQKGSDYIYIPAQLESTQASKRENESQKVLFSIGLFTVAIIIIILLVINSELSLLAKILLSAIDLLVFTSLIRFFIIKERSLASKIKLLEENNYTFSTRVFWKIYRIDTNYPYICYFKNGEVGLFVRLEKDSTLGNEVEIKYNHFESVGEAYRKLANTKLKMRYIDVMDNVGDDNRFEYLYDILNKSNCSKLKEVYTEIYEHMKLEMKEQYVTQDIYLFKMRGSEKKLYSDTLEVLSLMLDGSYVSYTILDSVDIGELTKRIMNLDEFSVNQACKSTKEVSKVKNITPIYSITVDGERIEFGKTSEEKKVDLVIKERENKARKVKKKVKEFDITLDEDKL